MPEPGDIEDMLAVRFCLAYGPGRFGFGLTRCGAVLPELLWQLYQFIGCTRHGLGDLTASWMSGAEDIMEFQSQAFADGLHVVLGQTRYQRQVSAQQGPDDEMIDEGRIRGSFAGDPARIQYQHPDVAFP